MSDTARTAVAGCALALGAILVLVFGVPLLFHLLSAWDRFLTLHMGAM